MRLGIDARCLPANGSAGAGIEHASRELCLALENALEESSDELFVFTVQGAELNLKTAKRIDLHSAKGPNLIQVAKDTKIDACLFPTGSIPVGFPNSIKTYPWIHDIAIFQHPEWFPQSWLRRTFTTWQFQHGLKRARHLFCVSQSTKQEVMKQFGIKEEDITVTGQGISASKEIWNPDRQKPYALILGTVEPRKNIPFIIELWPQVQAGLDQKIELVIAGKTGWGNVPIPTSAGIRRIPNLSDEERERLLAGASMVLLPSFHEGFGRVALEALATGAPVITSDRGALPEVVGKAGTILSLGRPQTWIKAIQAAFQSPDLSTLPSRQSQAARFSWPKTAQSMLAKIRAQ